jgi:hypothetical protein
MPKTKPTDKSKAIRPVQPAVPAPVTPPKAPTAAGSKVPNAASRKALREIEEGKVTVYESVEALFKKFRP